MNAELERYKKYKALLDAKWRQMAIDMKPTVDRIAVGMCWSLLAGSGLAGATLTLQGMDRHQSVDIGYPKSPQEAMDCLLWRKLVRFGRPRRTPATR